MSMAELDAFMEEHFPQERRFGATLQHLEPNRAVLRLPVGDANLRPGGTVSGPTLMTLADTAFYYLVLAMVGPRPLAVTTHLSIDFMRRPLPVDVLAEAELLKLGKRLAVGRVTLRSDGDPRAVAHAAVTYAVPPQ
ncbi:MAG: PaaI family thioesterase [Myxococcales bacterium]|nr:PaaI family thioesterase [Myxococcales bacterium]